MEKMQVDKENKSLLKFHMQLPKEKVTALCEMIKLCSSSWQTTPDSLYYLQASTSMLVISKYDESSDTRTSSLIAEYIGLDPNALCECNKKYFTLNFKNINDLIAAFQKFARSDVKLRLVKSKNCNDINLLIEKSLNEKILICINMDTALSMHNLVITENLIADFRIENKDSEEFINFLSISSETETGKGDLLLSIKYDNPSETISTFLKDTSSSMEFYYLAKSDIKRSFTLEVYCGWLEKIIYGETKYALRLIVTQSSIILQYFNDDIKTSIRNATKLYDLKCIQ